MRPSVLFGIGINKNLAYLNPVAFCIPDSDKSKSLSVAVALGFRFEPGFTLLGLERE